MWNSSDSRSVEGAARSSERSDCNENTSRKRRAVFQPSSANTQLWEDKDNDMQAQTIVKVSCPSTIDQGDTDRSSSITENDDQDEEEEEEDAWPLSLHRSLVEAIYEVGLKHASPAVLMEKMQFATENVTSERVKSHLQKYRNSKEKTKEEFMQEYDNGLLAAQTGTALVPGPPERYHGGERAAYLTYLVLQEEQRRTARHALPQPDPTAASTTETASTPLDDQILSFPTLTEEEQKTPLGNTIRQVIGLFHPLAQYIWSERIKQTSTPAASPSAAAEPPQQPFLSSCQDSSEGNQASSTVSWPRP